MQQDQTQHPSAMATDHQRKHQKQRQQQQQHDHTSSQDGMQWAASHQDKLSQHHSMQQQDQHGTAGWCADAAEKAHNSAAAAAAAAGGGAASPPDDGSQQQHIMQCPSFPSAAQQQQPPLRAAYSRLSLVPDAVADAQRQVDQFTGPHVAAGAGAGGAASGWSAGHHLHSDTAAAPHQQHDTAWAAAGVDGGGDDVDVDVDVDAAKKAQADQHLQDQGLLAEVRAVGSVELGVAADRICCCTMKLPRCTHGCLPRKPSWVVPPRPACAVLLRHCKSCSLSPKSPPQRPPTTLHQLARCCRSSLCCPPT